MQDKLQKKLENSQCYGDGGNQNLGLAEHVRKPDSWCFLALRYNRAVYPKHSVVRLAAEDRKSTAGGLQLYIVQISATVWRPCHTLGQLVRRYQGQQCYLGKEKQH